VGVNVQAKLCALGLAAVMMWPPILWPEAGDPDVGGDSGATEDAVPEAAGSAVVIERLVCRRERVIGSNLPQRVCRTQTQIVREREAAQELLRSQERSYPSAAEP
jgi:hypothetical protein